MAKQPFTMKERLFIKAYFESKGNATEAARQAYGLEGHPAEQKGYLLVRKLSGPIGILMDSCGLSDIELMRILKEGLAAKKTVFAKHEGNITDHRDCIDYPTRGKYLDTALKAKGKLITSLDVDGQLEETIIVKTIITDNRDDIEE